METARSVSIGQKGSFIDGSGAAPFQAGLGRWCYCEAIDVLPEVTVRARTAEGAALAVSLAGFVRTNIKEGGAL